METPSNFINEFDEDFTAYFFSEHYVVEPDEGTQHPACVVFRLYDLEHYEDVERKTDVSVLVVPTVVTDSTWTKIEQGSNCPRTPQAVAELAVGYGAYAHVTPFASRVASVSFSSLAKVAERDDYDEISEWIRKNGQTVADMVFRFLGFALDQQQNMIGETGWDWFLQHVAPGYTSETLWA